MKKIRQATVNDLSRIAEIIVFNYRLNFYPIFQNDDFYFGEMQVVDLVEQYKTLLNSMWVYDDGVVKGVIHVEDREIKKLFIEPVLQGNSIGAKLLEFAVNECNANSLWALEKNVRAIRFYERNGFRVTPQKTLEEGTSEYLVYLER